MENTKTETAQKYDEESNGDKNKGDEITEFTFRIIENQIKILKRIKQKRHKIFMKNIMMAKLVIKIEQKKGTHYQNSNNRKDFFRKQKN